MASEPVILSDPRIIAEFLRQDEFKGIFEKRFAVPPDYAALLFKNGQLIDAFKGGHFSVGGVVDKMKGIVGGSTHISMMIADLKPFQVQTVVQSRSKDNIDIAGVVTLELQVNPDKPSNFLGMMHGIDRAPGDGNELGRKVLTKSAVLARVRPHLSDRVFDATIGRIDAVDVRGDVGLQDKLQAEMMLEVERVVGDLGVLVRATSIEWAENAEESALQARAEALRQQDEVDFQIDLAKRNAERIHETTVFSIESEVELAKLQNASEDDLKHMALNSEIKFIDAREDAKRRQELDELEHQIVFLEKERAAQFENAIASAQNETELKTIQQKQLKLDVEMDAMRQLHMQKMKQSGAFSEAEVTALIQKQQREHVAGLQEIELRAEKVRAELKRIEVKADQAHEIEKLILQKDMTAEQILAVQAGLSPDVAAVLAERARSDAGANEDSMKLMREMVEAATASQIRSEAQAREMFQMGMQGAVGVAAGSGGGAAKTVVVGGGEAAASSEIECPKCRTTTTATSKFCPNCGHKLRT
ncbi:MAG: hypothetical protein ABJG15_13740 [Hyphomonadaceae bacterium]